MADLFLLLPRAKILKLLGNTATLLTIVYGSYTKAMSMLYCSIICVRLEVVARECFEFSCKHFVSVFRLDLLVLLCKL